MKKLLKITKNLIISSLLVLLFIPILVLADGASPGFASYDAFVSDPEGASLYLLDDSKLIKTNIVLKYNDEIYVEDEVKVSKDTFYAKIDGEKYKDQLDSSYKGYENWYYYINTDRIAIRGK